VPNSLDRLLLYSRAQDLADKFMHLSSSTESKLLPPPVCLTFIKYFFIAEKILDFPFSLKEDNQMGGRVSKYMLCCFFFYSAQK